MLCCLRIENFALIDHLELDLQAGLMVLTGETGAGKSIILDALDLALGGKATARLIRAKNDQGDATGERAFIEATFSLTPSIKQWLQSQDIDLLEDETVICSRELSLTRTGLRSRSRVNGIILNQGLMAELRAQLLEITAQGQTVELLIPERQRILLDSYGGSQVQQQRQLVNLAYQTYLKAKQLLESRRTSEQERLQRLDLLQYQLQELRDAHLEDSEELETLQQEGDRLSHVVELQQLSYQAHQILYQNDDPETPAVADLLGEAENLLKEMVDYDTQLNGILDMVRNALTEVVEAGHQISTYNNNLEADPEQLADIEARMRVLKQICRKYGPTLSEAIAYRDKLQGELDVLTAADQSLEALEQDCGIKYQDLEVHCQKLSQLRQKAAQKLEKQLIKELKPLAMAKVSFECRLSPISPTAAGADQVTFYFSPNPGEVAQPLAEIASGGEMSRFLLALKACFTQQQTTPKTLVFDEIDAGVSGKVAQAIATKLHHLSQYHQVLCVTHQPLIAAMADGHFRVTKQVQSQAKNQKGDRTLVAVESLQHHQKRRDELAQLTGGHAAEEAISFAESLLVQAQTLKAGSKMTQA
ncbi:MULTISPECIES: DNA repair protein RecN [Cyanophyceae]|uniref:DNA repair protein RecN n=1 Tax=Cyanophyceae TaxID=3028117 RepID=UPI00016DC725|nr:MULTISPECIES: DNA repair protein RecN [Cyanophyceae]ACA98459.1 DNA repair protein RecN [Picosynechococcus sp. PCC 7002]SMH47057.1 DNA replication and repair protein RecN [Picosynechococcus sp. OG1]SMQ80934.1 DNA replication and repair protein RecN [Synechococcus sp. 7002]